MITIVSEEQDIMTDLTMEWLVAKKAPTRRIQDFEPQTFHIDINNEVRIENDELTDKSYYWTRRGRENYIPATIDNHFSDEQPVYRYLEQDELVVSSYMETRRKQQLDQNNSGSFFAEKKNNKLTNLEFAKSVGLLIPPTCVTNCKAVLTQFLQRYKKVITKDLRSPVYLPEAKGTLTSSGVISIGLADLDSMAENFAAVFVQENISKQFEIRSFLFQKAIFSMAIFSQNDQLTATDFRNYNDARPNRCVPFQLPPSVEKKLLNFMELAELDTGSIDLIYTPEGKYVFLEVNPMGQFHWLSENCNYYLEHFIADAFTNA
ncbi:MAG: hypothetical protein AB8H12_16910 [Lewinella sp.]